MHDIAVAKPHTAWLSDANRKLAEEANCLVASMWKVFACCLETRLKFLGDHPEDLGATPAGRPASV